MGPNVAKLVNLVRIWICACRPLIRPIIHQRVMLEGPESPKSPQKLVIPENVSISAFYTVILGEMDPKVAKLDNLAKTGLRVNFNNISAFFSIFMIIFFIFVC